MPEALVAIWKSKDIRNRILFTLGVFILIRFIAHIPIPEINKAELAKFLGQSQNQVFGVLSLFTGGALSKLSIDLMGVGPYITASIVVQLLSKAIPSWEAISKEGNSGREKLNQYTRYLTVPLAFIQGYATLTILKTQSVLPNFNFGQLAEILLAITATSIFVMWLGELISERGIGNGISMIIGLNIIAGLPQQFTNTASTISGTGNYLSVFMVLALIIITIIIIILIYEAQRNLPITYARRSSGVSSAVDSYLPLKVNTAGVIPIIFALSFLTIPQFIAKFLATAKSAWLVNASDSVSAFLGNQLYYGIIYFILVFIFTFFYTFIVFQPEQVAEDLQKQGSFIPGIRPGRETKNFIQYVLMRITNIGALFLALIALLPLVIQYAINLPTLVIGGTSILIVVSVIIETNRQLNSLIVMHRYETL